MPEKRSGSIQFNGAVARVGLPVVGVLGFVCSVLLALLSFQMRSMHDTIAENTASNQAMAVEIARVSVLLEVHGKDVDRLNEWRHEIADPTIGQIKQIGEAFPGWWLKNGSLD